MQFQIAYQQRQFRKVGHLIDMNLLHTQGSKSYVLLNGNECFREVEEFLLEIETMNVIKIILNSRVDSI